MLRVTRQTVTQPLLWRTFKRSSCRNDRDEVVWKGCVWRIYEKTWCIWPPWRLPGCVRWKDPDAARIMLDGAMRIGDVSWERIQGEKKRRSRDNHLEHHHLRSKRRTVSIYQGAWERWKSVRCDRNLNRVWGCEWWAISHTICPSTKMEKGLTDLARRWGIERAKSVRQEDESGIQTFSEIFWETRRKVAEKTFRVWQWILLLNLGDASLAVGRFQGSIDWGWNDES